MILWYLSYILLFLGLFLFFFTKFIQRKNTYRFEKRTKKKPVVAILIPARDESKVIESLLLSIERQTYKVNPSHIYIIVESEDDPSVEIAHRHHMNVFVRKKLDLQTKGYALAEIIEDLVSKEIYYDCYFIFDADNVLEENFMEEMIKDYQKGFAVSTGYRALKNTDSYFSVSAGLTFFLVNEIRNRASLKNQGNLILSGTGYYIDGKYIKEWGTFPFRSLTEDYESSLYYTVEGISTNYNENAIFYDEQPEKYSVSLKQRSRWVKGYFQNWLGYQKKLKEKEKEHPHNEGSIFEMRMGILPVIFLVVAILLMMILEFCSIFSFHWYTFFSLFLFCVLVYAMLVLITAVLLWMAGKKMKLSKKIQIQVLFYHPIFLISYIHAVFIAIIKKDLKWEKIERL